jgi:hypothetical protein
LSISIWNAKKTEKDGNLTTGMKPTTCHFGNPTL